MKHTTAAVVYENALSHRLAKDFQRLISMADTGQSPPTDTAAPSTTQQAKAYITTAFHWSEDIIRTCEQLAFIPLYIKDFEPREQYREANLSEHENIRFFMETFFIKSCSAYEKCLHLLNHVYDAGQNEMRLSYRKILARIKGTATEAHLSAVWELVQDYNDSRNAVIHRRHFNNSALDDLATLGLIAGVRSDATYRVGYDLLADDYKHKALDFCNISNEKLFAAILALLDTCAADYSRQLAALDDA